MTREEIEKLTREPVIDRPTDPDNRWLWAQPLTAEQLAALRKRRVAIASEMRGEAPAEFTCDQCTLAPRCTLAFDAYNVDGDCLYEK